MIVIVAQDRANTDRWFVHYRRGEELEDDISDFAKQIIVGNLTSYAMIRLKNDDKRQSFQNKTIQKLKLDPNKFTSGVSVCGLCKILEHVGSRTGTCPVKNREMYRNYHSCSEFKPLSEDLK